MIRRPSRWVVQPCGLPYPTLRVSDDSSEYKPRGVDHDRSPEVERARKPPRVLAEVVLRVTGVATHFKLTQLRDPTPIACNLTRRERNWAIHRMAALPPPNVIMRDSHHQYLSL